ncbi:MAG: DNA-processing protein DprA [Clostridia bacterium]|nr:DNA-processing protein DprA [Clostridia bacterium]
MSESLYWVWLSLKLGDASPYLNKLVSQFASPKEIYEASRSELLSLDKIPDSVKNRLADKNLDRAERILEDCRKSGIGIMTFADPRYPRILKYISNPPAVLYFKGKPIDFDRKLGVAVVGTRSMSDYGRDMAYKFAYELSSAGAVVVSGMALGVDGMAAAGALDAQAATVVVLGGGVDVVYPKAHKKLYNSILKDGLVLSEYPPGTISEPSHFPKRNRIISGLARCTLVVECPEHSGALITANKASAQGRPIFSIPGALNMEKSVGANKLIKDGAKMVTSVTDILDAFEQSAFSDLDINAIGAVEYDAKKAANRYGVESKKDERSIISFKKSKGAVDTAETEPASSLGTEKEQKEPKREFAILAPLEKQIYDNIPNEGDVSMDFLVASTGIGEDSVNMHLLSLTCKGAVVELPGKRYRRI